jgi:hypothetical protein
MAGITGSLLPTCSHRSRRAITPRRCVVVPDVPRQPDPELADSGRRCSVSHYQHGGPANVETSGICQAPFGQDTCPRRTIWILLFRHSDYSDRLLANSNTYVGKPAPAADLTRNRAAPTQCLGQGSGPGHPSWLSFGVPKPCRWLHPLMKLYPRPRPPRSGTPAPACCAASQGVVRRGPPSEPPNSGRHTVSSRRPRRNRRSSPCRQSIGAFGAMKNRV